MNFPLWLTVSSWSIQGGLFTIINIFPFDCTAFVVTGKVEYPQNGLTTPVG